MNCLLLLFILLCCGGNGGGGSHGHNCNCNNFRKCNSASGTANNNGSGRDNCETMNHSCHTPPPMPRTQFPYLDVEPRTCGCEEKSNS